MNPKMLLIFEKDYTDKVSRGELCAFASHAAMNLTLKLEQNVAGHFKGPYYQCSIERGETKPLYDKWQDSDYKKIVLTTKTFGEIVDFTKVNGYCFQHSAHDKQIKCLAIFGDSKDLNKLSKGMELLKWDVQNQLYGVWKTKK